MTTDKHPAPMQSKAPFDLWRTLLADDPFNINGVPIEIDQDAVESHVVNELGSPHTGTRTLRFRLAVFAALLVCVGAGVGIWMAARGPAKMSSGPEQVPVESGPGIAHTEAGAEAVTDTREFSDPPETGVAAGAATEPALSPVTTVPAGAPPREPRDSAIGVTGQQQGR